MGQTFYPRVSLITSSGEHVRYVPGPLAAALVRGGTASASPGVAKVRSVTLSPVRAERIGDPTNSTSMSVRFTRWRRLNESGTRIVEHHPRCLY